MSPAILHVTHDLGGGVQNWLEDLSQAAPGHRHLFLRSHGTAAAFGSRLTLHDSAQGPSRMEWPIDPPISSTADSHAGVEQVLHEIGAREQVHAVLVSSLIGHSLDVLRSPWPTTLAMHDFHPWCPAIQIHWHGVCRSCDTDRLTACVSGHPDSPFFAHQRADDLIRTREAFVRTVLRDDLPIVVPTPSTARHLTELEPRLCAASIRVLPYGRPDAIDGPPGDDADSPPRIALLGRLVAGKGSLVTPNLLRALSERAEVVLLGCGERPASLDAEDRIRCIPSYRREHLPRLLRTLRPTLGLLASAWPETFSYTLTELWSAGIPPVATAVGAFLDRVREGETGFLSAPEGQALLRTVDRVLADPQSLRQVRANLPPSEGPSWQEVATELLPPTPISSAPPRWTASPRTA